MGLSIKHSYIKILHLTILLFLLVNGSGFAQTNKVPNTRPFVLGVIDKIQSKELSENRILNIYLPEGYNQNDTIKYPVIYLLDGSADEDFIHVTGLVQYFNFPWINKVPKSIVVGIATVDRKRDFTYPTRIDSDRIKYPTTGHSDKFMSFIEKELQPYIEKKYAASKTRTIIGQSLGGLFVSEILFKKPALFDKYLIISPSLWWDDGSLLEMEPDSLKFLRSQITVYIAVGKEGLTPGSKPRLMEDDAKLLSDKLKEHNNKNVKVYFDYLPDEDHATIGHQAVYNGFKILYKGMEHD